MIDSHIHLDFFPPEEIDGLLADAREKGIDGFVVPAAAPKNWERVRSLVESLPDAKAAFGVHPWFASEVTDLETTMGDLRKLLALPKVVALGECGLDRLREETVPRAIQETVFAAQLDLAVELDLPVVLHAVKAVDAVLSMVENAGVTRGIFHGFVGSLETAKRVVEKGFFLGIGPRALDNMRTVAALGSLPLESVLLETDAPDTHFWNDERGNPADLVRVLSELAKARGESIDFVREVTAENARRVFE